VDVDGRYSDGRTAATINVRIRLDNDHLTLLRADDGTMVASWPLAPIRLIDDVARNAPARLAPGPDRDERLSLTSAELIAELARRNRDLRRGAYGQGREWRPVLFWSVGAVASLVALFLMLPFFSHQLAFVVPVAMEQRAGRWMSELIIAQMGGEAAKRTGIALCEAPDGRAALDRLVQRLTAATPSRLDLTVRVVNTKMVNALALPGGQILIFRGLIDKAASPNAVAGVLAHEIGHVDLRHSTEVAIQQTTTGVVVGMLVGDVAGFSALGSLATTLIGSRYTRDAESAADAHAVAMMRAAGFAANPFAVFMEQMESPSGGPLDALSYLASHPPSPERAARIRAGGTDGKDALSPAEWAALKAICGPAPPSK
jgi:Zn-dependent protease with chaperone function